MGKQEPTVLIVDDDLATRQMLRAFFEGHGYTVEEAADGHDALTLAEKLSPESVLADVVLPGLTGYQLCEKLRGNPRTAGAVIILLSAWDTLDVEVSCFEAGADDFLTKPFRLSQLRLRLQAHARRMAMQVEKEKMLERLAEKLALMNIRLKEEATTDVLTGLYNQRYFWKHLESEFARSKRTGRPLSLILMDLDRFKLINDQYGHFVGDTVLRELGKLMRSQLRGIDLVARSGGEEFGIILPETHLQNAAFIAQRLRLKCSAAQIHPLPQEGVTFSAGLAAFPQHGETPQALYERADQALYQAKAQGRNCVVAA